MTKSDFPVDEIRWFLEPGPIVLVSSHYKGKNNIMTMGWHMVAETSPSLVCCYIWTENHSREMIRKSRDCVINIPTANMIDVVVGIGNTSGRDVDKFAKFGLHADPAENVSAPLVRECHASFECKLYDDSMVRKRSLFIFEVVKGHAKKRPKYPETIHYRGEGMFTLSGRTVNKRRLFKAKNL
jgi:flavin reductase (DIM6/NTAB) family NADH-FMN oxidoreductase RutF